MLRYGLINFRLLLYFETIFAKADLKFCLVYLVAMQVCFFYECTDCADCLELQIVKSLLTAKRLPNALLSAVAKPARHLVMQMQIFLCL